MTFDVIAQQHLYGFVKDWNNVAGFLNMIDWDLLW